MSLLVEVTKVSLQSKSSEQKALLLSHRLVVMQQVVTQLQIVLQPRCLLPEQTTTTAEWPLNQDNLAKPVPERYEYQLSQMYLCDGIMM